MQSGVCPWWFPALCTLPAPNHKLQLPAPPQQVHTSLLCRYACLQLCSIPVPFLSLRPAPSFTIRHWEALFYFSKLNDPPVFPEWTVVQVSNTERLLWHRLANLRTPISSHPGHRGHTAHICLSSRPLLLHVICWKSGSRSALQLHLQRHPIPSSVTDPISHISTSAPSPHTAYTTVVQPPIVPHPAGRCSACVMKTSTRCPQCHCKGNPQTCGEPQLARQGTWRLPKSELTSAATFYLCDLI